MELPPTSKLLDLEVLYCLATQLRDPRLSLPISGQALLFRRDWKTWLSFIETPSFYVDQPVLELDGDVDQAGLELVAICLPLPPECWD